MAVENKTVGSFTGSCTKSSEDDNQGRKIICVECGKEALQAYKQLRGGIIRLSHCEACSSVVDKYVEYDSVLIILDILLHKAQAYRHLLFNRRLDFHWQLCLVFLFCDAYIKWWYLKHSNDISNMAKSNEHPKNQEISLLELQFYVMLNVAVVEFGIFIVSIYGTLKLTSVKTGKVACSSFKEISLALLISSFAKTFVIPVVQWGSSEIEVFLPLIRLLVITSNSESLKVLLKIGFHHAFIVVLLGNMFVLFLSNTVIDNVISFIL